MEVKRRYTKETVDGGMAIMDNGVRVSIPELLNRLNEMESLDNGVRLIHPDRDLYKQMTLECKKRGIDVGQLFDEADLDKMQSYRWKKEDPKTFKTLKALEAALNRIPLLDLTK